MSSPQQLPSFTLQPQSHSLPTPTMEKLLLSPSGRYILELQAEEIQQGSKQEKNTHYFRHKFILFDLYSRQWSVYSSLVGPLHNTRLFYWLADDALVIVTFSRHFEKLEQNLILFDHTRQLVDNSLARRYEWSVDAVLAFHEKTNVTPLVIQGQEYLPVFGERDDTDGLFLLPVPYRLSSSMDRLHQLEIPERAIYRRFVPSSTPAGYPFTLGGKLLFRFTAANLTYLQIVNSFVSLDVEQFFKEDQTDYVVPHSASLSVLTVPHEAGDFPISMPNYFSMDNEVSRHLYYVRFTTSCFVVDFEKNRCEWIRPFNVDEQYDGEILMHPSGLILNLASHPQKATEIIVRSFGRSRLRVPSLEKMALTTVIENSTIINQFDHHCFH